MEGSITEGERRRYPWVLIDLPIEYREMDESCLRGAIVFNAGGAGDLPRVWVTKNHSFSFPSSKRDASLPKSSPGDSFASKF
jgi:hypothetical protein